MKYTVKYSKRKSLQLEINRQAEVVVRAPFGVPERVIADFVRRNETKLREFQKKQQEKHLRHPEPTEEEKALLIRRAKEYLPKKTMEYAVIMGVEPTGIKITSAKTRFGSCSGKNSICYSWRLMQYPQEAIDYVVVHELAHIIHKNHSRAFYLTVERYMPDYRRRRAMLKE